MKMKMIIHVPKKEIFTKISFNSIDHKSAPIDTNKFSSRTF